MSSSESRISNITDFVQGFPDAGTSGSSNGDILDIENGSHQKPSTIAEASNLYSGTYGSSLHPKVVVRPRVTPPDITYERITKEYCDPLCYRYISPPFMTCEEVIVECEHAKIDCTNLYRQRTKSFRAINIEEKEICHVINIPADITTAELWKLFQECESNLYRKSTKGCEHMCIDDTQHARHRGVYYLVVGQLMYYKIDEIFEISEIQDPSDAESWHALRLNLLPRIQLLRGYDELLTRVFTTRTKADEFVKKFCSRNLLDLGKFKMLHKISKTWDPQVFIDIVDSLKCVIEKAEAENAVLVIPHYLSCASGSFIIQAALQRADFKGIVVNCCNQGWIAETQDEAELCAVSAFECLRADPFAKVLSPLYCLDGVELGCYPFSSKTAGVSRLPIGVERKDQEADDGHSIAKGVLLDRATFSFQAMSEKTGLVSDLASRIALAISGLYKQDVVVPDPSAFQRVVAVVANGGVLVLDHIATMMSNAAQEKVAFVNSFGNERESEEIVRYLEDRNKDDGERKFNIPVIFLQGSGRLSDHIGAIYNKRFSEQFLVGVESRRLLMACGMMADDAPESDVRIGILAQNIKCIIENQSVMFHHISTRVERLKCLIDFVLDDQDEALSFAYDILDNYKCALQKRVNPDTIFIALKTLIGFLTTLLSTVQSQLPEYHFNQTDVNLHTSGYTASKSNILYVVMVVLPILLSVVVSLQQDLNYRSKILSWKYAAFVLESEIYRYRTRTSVYGEQQCLLAAQNDDGLGNFDTMSARAKILLERLSLIAANVETVEDHSVQSSFWASSFRFAGNGNQEVYRSTKKRRDVMSRLDAESYVENRLNTEMIRLERDFNTSSLQLLLFRVFNYVIGAVGSILSILNFAVNSSAFFSCFIFV